MSHNLWLIRYDSYPSQLEQFNFNCVFNFCFQNTSKCKNLIPFYECSCKTGFQKFVHRDILCYDINECKHATCHKHTTCRNNIGSFTCQCNPGFEGNGQNCINIGRTKSTYRFLKICIKMFFDLFFRWMQWKNT